MLKNGVFRQTAAFRPKLVDRPLGTAVFVADELAFFRSVSRIAPIRHPGTKAHISESRCGHPLCPRRQVVGLDEGGSELLRRCGDEHDEQDQQEELGDFEWRFGAGGGEGVEDGDVLEGLRDEDEDVEVEGEHGDGEHDYREDAEDDAWSDLGVGKAEAGKAGKDGGDEKDAVPGAEESAFDEAEENDEARSDADEADEDVQCGVRA